MRNISKIAAFLVVGAAAAATQGALTGTNVTGALYFNNNLSTNRFDSATNVAGAGVPATGYLNSNGATTVPISTTDIEFGYADAPNTIRADFGASTLLINDISQAGFIATQYSFTDDAFAGQAITESSDTFPLAPTVTLIGNTITIKFQTTTTSGNFNAVYVIGPAVPEPASLGGAIGVAAVGLLRRRRTA